MKTDFLIVGGGIGGLVLAEMLGRSGKKVIVLEKSTKPPPFTRPEILWPATVELLFALLPRAAWEERALLPLRELQIFDGHGFVPAVTPGLMAEAGVQPWSTDPNQTRELLFSLKAFELHRGVEVVEVLKDKDRIVGARARKAGASKTFDILAEWTVGDDGSNSLVRKAAGIELKTRVFPIEFLAFTPRWPEDFPERAGRIWPNLKDPRSGIIALGVLPVPQKKAAGIVLIQARDYDRNKNVEGSWRSFCAMDERIEDVTGGRRFPAEFPRIRRVYGHAEHYGCDGALLMGDAAHPVSPAGGQGANMSIADARVIAELAESNTRCLAAEYERRRRTANQRALGPTRTAAALQSLPSWLRPVSLLFGLARLAGRRPERLKNGLKFVSTAFMER